MMIWTSWLGLALAFLLILPVYGRTSSVTAGLVLGLCGASFVAACAIRENRWRSVGASLFRLTGAAAACVVVTPLLYLVGSRWHSVGFLDSPVSGVLSLLGFDAVAAQGAVHVYSKGQFIPISLTVEKLGLLPLTWILVAAIILVCSLRRQCSWPRMGLGLVGAGLYAVLRFVLVAVVVLQYNDPGNVNGESRAILPFQDPFYQWLSFLPLAAWFAFVFPIPRGSLELRVELPLLRASVAGPVVAAAVFCGVGFFQHQDPGVPKQGRVLLDEIHSPQWEIASRPFDTSEYGRDAVYNYRTLHDYLEHYYEIRLNLTERYTPQVLDEIDVLILKTPTVPFDEVEIEAVCEFVRKGGGLFLIGDHTNLLGMSDNLNQIAERFLFRFNHDASNRLDDLKLGTFSSYAGFPHPASRVDLEFMTSCTLSAPLTHENVMICENAFSDPRDYSADSFFGNVVADVDDDFGLHVMATAVKYGKGRVLAFADSTVLSNFGVMYPGRPEFLLGSIEYLNRKNVHGYQWNRVLLRVSGVLGLLSLLLGLGASMRFWRWALAPLFMLLGLVMGCVHYSAQIEDDYPLPDPRKRVEFVAFLEEGFDYALPPALVGSMEAPERCFDTFFVWIQRLGLFPRCMSIPAAVENARVIVAVNPCGELDDEAIGALADYVREGGSLLVLDSVLNTNSTCNRILAPFGMSVHRARSELANVYADRAWLAAKSPGSRVYSASMESLPVLQFDDLLLRPLAAPLTVPHLRLMGGSALYKDEEGQAFAVHVKYGEGRVVAVVDSVLFSRLCMGRTDEEIEQGSRELQVAELEYRLFGEVVLPRGKTNEDSKPQ